MKDCSQAERLFNENYDEMVRRLGYYARKCPGEPFEDAMQNMLLKCWKACGKFRCDGGAKFHSYVTSYYGKSYIKSYTQTLRKASKLREKPLKRRSAKLLPELPLSLDADGSPELEEARDFTERIHIGVILDDIERLLKNKIVGSEKEAEYAYEMFRELRKGTPISVIADTLKLKRTFLSYIFLVGIQEVVKESELF